MKLSTLLRISPAVWISPIVVLLAMAYTTVLRGTADPCLAW